MSTNGKTLTKADIVDQIYEKTEKNRAEVKILVDSLLEKSAAREAGVRRL